MAKPNYSFQKRQRDLAKKQKKEQKAARKNARAASPDDAADSSATEAGDHNERKPEGE